MTLFQTPRSASLHLARSCQRFEALLRLPRQVQKEQGHCISCVPVSDAIDNDPYALQFPFFARRLQGDGHLLPNWKGCLGLEFDTVATDANGTGWKREVIGTGLNGIRPERA
jgi:hypothetical protein